MSGAPPRPSNGLLWTVFLLTMLEFLQSGMVAFAAGPIMGHIGASPEEYGLATAAYACIAILAISKQRWLVERLGWRRYVQFSVAFFVLGTALCADSDTFGSFVVGRSVMGLGGAAFMTSARIIVNLIPPSRWRFVGIKCFATGLACGIALAPGLASAAVAHDSWHLIFLMLAVVAVFAGVAATCSLPTELAADQLRSRSNPLAFMLLASSSFLLLYVMQRSQYDFFSDLLPLGAGVAIAATALYGYCRALLAHERPLLALRALRQPRYIMGVALFTLCYVVLGANNYVLPVLLQRTLGYPWYLVGRIQTLGLMSALLAWLVMAWVMPRWPGAKKFFVAGFLALASSGWQMARLTGEADLLVDVLPALLGNGLFLMLVMATTAVQTFRDVQHHEAILSSAQQFKNMVAQFGMAVGVALATVGLQWRTTLHYGSLNGRFVAGGEQFTDRMHGLAAVLIERLGEPQAAAHSMALLAQQMSQQATLLACLDYFLVVGWIGLAGAAAMAAQRLMR